MYCKCRNSAHNQGFGKSAKNIEVMEKVKKRKETKIKEPTTVCCLSIYHSGEKHFFVCADGLLQKWLANAIHLYSFDMFILLSGLVRLWVKKKKWNLMISFLF